MGGGRRKKTDKQNPLSIGSVIESLIIKTDGNYKYSLEQPWPDFEVEKIRAHGQLVA